MKRGMSGRTRRGSPPLPRQRKALRVVQLTLAGLSVVLGALAWSAVNQGRHPLPVTTVLGAPSGHGIGEAVALGVGTVCLAGLALSMGIRIVRGPEPHVED